MIRNINLQYLESLDINNFKFSLSRIRKTVSLLLLKKKYKLIHVAGTNGKGSVSSYISKILAISGFRVGLYTSPHLVDIKERIKILNNDKERIITNKDFHNYIKKIRIVLEKNNIKLTYFEFLTAVTLKYFDDNNLDFVILETGLGGRLDATNVFEKVDISIITNISLEHTNYLGKTKEKIAYEKAGIIKKNSILITGEQDDRILNIFRKISEKKNTKLYILNKDFGYKIRKKINDKFNFDYFIKSNSQLYRNFKNIDIAMPFLARNDNVSGVIAKNEVTKQSILKNNLVIEDKNQDIIQIKDLIPGLSGKFQLDNAAISITAILYLTGKYSKISFQAIKKGLKNVNLPARNQLIKYKNKNVLLDSAHNPQAIKSLTEYLRNNYQVKKIIFVIGILKDKDGLEISRLIKKENFKKIIFTTPLSKRALKCNEFLRYYEQDKESNSISSVDRLLIIEDYFLAVDYALSISENNDLCVLCGSFYITGEFLKNYA